MNETPTSDEETLAKPSAAPGVSLDLTAVLRRYTGLAVVVALVLLVILVAPTTAGR